jgi:two-component system sensor histidine kinase DesK
VGAVLISRWWSGLTGLERFDLATRWPLYLYSGLEPVVVIWLVLAQSQGRAWGAVLLLLVTVAHTVACLALLRAGLAHPMGTHPPPTRLVALTVTLTAAGLAAGVAAFPAYGRGVQGDLQVAYPVGLVLAVLFCGALTAAATPLLRRGQLLVAVALPVAVVGVLQFCTDNGHGHQTQWAVNYLVLVGTAVLVYRVSVWYLAVLWEIDRSRDVQARLAVAEERLRFARDLHDVLGRNLTLIALNSELAAQMVRRGQDGAIEHMLEVRQVAQDTMREMREVAGGQRTTDLDSELGGARSVLRSAGISARVVGDGAGLPRPVQAALGWVVREATTNILRHSDPTSVTIELDVVQDGDTGPAAVLRIENDGVHPADSGGGANGGSGLVGLRARLADLGGDLDAEALTGSRFVVQVRLPLARRSPVAATAAEPMP